FDVNDAPSASVLALVRRQHASVQQRAPKLLVGFGDAVFSPEYLPGGAKAAVDTAVGTRFEEPSKLKKLPRLFHAKGDQNAIGEVAGSNSAFYVEYNATRDYLTKVDLSQYRILHVVTHGVFHAGVPQHSGLVLSLINEKQQPIDGFVRLTDIYKLRA